MLSWLPDISAFRMDSGRRRIRRWQPLVEHLESRQLLAAVNLQPGDIILQRNYRPPGSEDADSGFLIYHPATQQATPLVIPRLNDPANINYGVYVADYELSWETLGETQLPHIIFSGGIVPDPADPGDSLAGIFDFDITAGTLTAIHSEESFGGRPFYTDFAVNSDGVLVRTLSTDRDDFSQVIGQSSIGTLNESVTYFEQQVSVVEESFGILYDFDGPTSSLAFDASGVLYAGFTQDDGFFNHSDEVHTVGNVFHNPGVYRLDQDGPRELIYDAGAGRVYVQIAPDGSIIALVGDELVRRYYKQDIALERVVRIDPVTKAVQTLFVGPKKYDYESIQVDDSGNVFLGATDNSKDGNTNVFQLVTSGKKKPKTKAVEIFQDDVGGNASYGVVTTGNIVVVKVEQTPLPEAGDISNVSTAHHRTGKRRGHQPIFKKDLGK